MSTGTTRPWWSTPKTASVSWCTVRNGPGNYLRHYTVTWWNMSRSTAKQHAAERAVAGDERSGMYVYYEAPGDIVEVKIYAPWRSYLPSAEELRIARKIMKYNKLILDELRHV